MLNAVSSRSLRFGARFLAGLFVFLFSVSHAGNVRLTPEEEEALTQVGVYSRASVAVAKIIRPAVVHIKVERRVEGRIQPRSFNNPLDFFFGPRPPSQLMQPPSQIQTSQGSGVVVDAEGYILTNNHVVGEAERIQVVLFDGREFSAELIGSDPASEVAVIKINADNLTVANFADSDLIEVGEWVMAVGNPFGLDFTVTSGIISARGRSGMGVMEIEDFIQTDASINPGNSGGPLVNLRGEVIGINTFIYSTQNGPIAGSIGVGFAIPSNMAKSIMQSLISHKQVITSYLGVESSSLDQDMAQAFGLQAPRGALIEAVTKGSPAEKAGLQRGDIVVRWGKREIADDQQFRNLVTISPPEQPVDVEVVRGGEIMTLSVILVDTPPEMVIKGRSDRFLQNLGIEVIDATPDVLQEIGYEPTDEGVLVVQVERGSPAYHLSIRPGSLILNVNGKDVRSIQELMTVIGASNRVKNYDLVWRYGMFVRRARLSVN